MNDKINEQIRSLRGITITSPADDIARRFSSWARAELTRGRFVEPSQIEEEEKKRPGSANGGAQGTLPEKVSNEQINEELRATRRRERE